MLIFHQLINLLFALKASDEKDHGIIWYKLKDFDITEELGEWSFNFLWNLETGPSKPGMALERKHACKV